MTFEQFTEWRISVSACVFAVASIVVLSQLSQALPGQLYFTFAGFMYAEPRPNVCGYTDEAGDEERAEEEQPPTKPPTKKEARMHLLAVVFKLAIPAIVGLLLGWFWGAEGVSTAAMGGFGGAFLLAWPAIFMWDFVAMPEVACRRNTFLVAYALYALSYAYVCRAGAQSGAAFRERYATTNDGTSIVNWKAIVQGAVAGTVTILVNFVWSHAFLR